MKKLLNIEFLYAYMINFLWIYMLGYMQWNDLERKYLILIAAASALIMYVIILLPVNDWYYRKTLHLVKPNAREAGRIQNIWEKLYRDGGKYDIKIPRNIQIYIAQRDDVYACAMGQNTIAVSTDLLSGCTLEEACALIAHEVAHIVNGDTAALMLAILFTRVIGIVKLYLCFALWLAGKMFQIILLICGQGEIRIDAVIDGAMGIISEVVSVFMDAVAYLVTWLYRLIGRGQELKADRFSVSLGYGSALAHVLANIPQTERFQRIFMGYILQGVHLSVNTRLHVIEKTMG